MVGSEVRTSWVCLLVARRSSAAMLIKKKLGVSFKGSAARQWRSNAMLCHLFHLGPIQTSHFCRVELQ